MIFICSYVVLSQFVWQHDKYEFGLLFRPTVSTLFFCVLLWGTKSTSSSTECHDQTYPHDYNQELIRILYNATKISPQVALPIASRPNLCVFDILNLECINAVLCFL